MSILLSFCKILTQRRKEKRSLCSSNSDRHTLLYRLKVKYSLILSILSARSSAKERKTEQKQVGICEYRLVKHNKNFEFLVDIIQSKWQTVT